MLLMDKVCVIVGAGSPRGIAYATAHLFAEHGAKIVAVDRQMDEQKAQALQRSIQTGAGRDVEVLCLRCDITEYAQCVDLFSDIVAQFGRFDCLVNCAGIVDGRGFLEIEEEQFDRMVDVNLKGTFNLCKSALTVLNEQGSGSLINVASVAAQRGGGLVGGAHYSASKGGVISLTRSIAREFGPRGIRANIVCPSTIDTGMLDGTMSAEQIQDVIPTIPLRRIGRAQDIAGVCLFLASDLASYVTGATIDVNGGSYIH
jgi:NAD(P)-dependent dehydrogenase (short-subunit alcohol dehydrogenase family)